MSPTDSDLERHIHRELSSLDPPRAPATLLMRVLAGIERPWYTRAWLTWPAPARIGSALALVALLIGITWAAGAAHEFGTTSALARIGWRQLVLPAVAYVFATTLLVSLAVTASWAAITRVALEGAPE
jgi:hypothetical protein